MKLSILIPALAARSEYLVRLQKILEPQLTPEVEVIIRADNGEESTGAKRNKLLELAKGDYVVFIDDDDRVAPEYVAELMFGIEKQVDVVSMKGIITTNGANPFKFIDHPYTPWTRAGDGTYRKGVQHLDAIKRSIAIQFKFPLCSYGEDRLWDRQIEDSKLVRSYHPVSHPIYFYDYRNTEAKIAQFSVVISSSNAKNLIACVRSILDHETGILPHKIIIVDDGAKIMGKLGLPPGLTWVEGKKPFVFARNYNLGIAAADPDDDIVILHDDALLRTAGGLSALAYTTREHNYGVVSSATNFAVNSSQIHRGSNLIRPEGRTFSFACACISRQALSAVGNFDERFIFYGGEENDYCRRVRIYGMLLGVLDACFVDHLSLKATFRGTGRGRGNSIVDPIPGQNLYLEKWGDLR